MRRRVLESATVVEVVWCLQSIDAEVFEALEHSLIAWAEAEVCRRKFGGTQEFVCISP